MAVAVKNSPETDTSSAFDRMPVVSLVGVVYVLSSLAIVFGLLPYLWWQMWGSVFGNTNTFASGTLLGMLMLTAFTGLVVLGGQLLGPKAPPGVRAGIFTGLVGLVLVVGLTRWISVWAEHFCYFENLFGSAGKIVGVTVTTVAGLGLLLLFLRWFFRPSTEKWMGAFEEQGWFSSTSFKKNQGMRVRRGTIIGLMLLFGSGVYTLVNHKTLDQGPANWDLNIPFTGTVEVTKKDAGDALPLLEEHYPDWASAAEDKPLVIDRYQLREINKRLNPEIFVKIDYRGEPSASFTSFPFKDGQIVTKAEYEEAKKTAEKERLPVPQAVPPKPAPEEASFASITVLPSVVYTVPLLLLGLSVWFSWRVVNLPGFADFLIATEAELNKVLWTTRKRLYQDTIVVLITVALLAGYLFAMDQVWGNVLSWRPVGVIVFSKVKADKNPEQKPW